MLPEFKNVFETQLKLGVYKANPIRRFEFSPQGLLKVFGHISNPTEVLFGYGEDPDSLESMTLLACWSDEAGQKKYKRESKEALDRRLTIASGKGLGRHIFTTTPYFWNWLKVEIYDRAVKEAGRMAGMSEEERAAYFPMYECINFSSIENPVFPKEEYYRQKDLLPDWKFRMMYDGEFTKPAGMIYDCWDNNKNTCKRFEVPPTWRRRFGMDFGDVNLASVICAQDPKTKKVYIYRRYRPTQKTVADHVKAMRLGEKGRFLSGSGGANHENDWRNMFSAAGLPIEKPNVSDLHAGIDIVYAWIKKGWLIVFDDLEDVISDLTGYSREVDEVSGEPTDEIENKEDYHLADAVRYLLSNIPFPGEEEMFKYSRGVNNNDSTNENDLFGPADRVETLRRSGIPISPKEKRRGVGRVSGRMAS